MRRSLVISVVLVAAVGTWTFSSWGRYQSARSLAERKERELRAAQRDARSILALRELPRQAAEGTPDQEYLHGLLEELATSVGLPTRALASIQPAPPQRIGRTAYQEVATTVTLRRVQLRQLAELLYLVRKRRREFRLKELTLHQADRARFDWDATLVFAFLVFEPGGTGPGSL
jgi:hypothetical protein